MAKRKLQAQQPSAPNPPTPSSVTPSASSSATNIKIEPVVQKMFQVKQSPNSNPPKIIMPSNVDGSTTLLQKRRRVVRACDRCRKLKIKCSGDLPCIHCTVYSYECTYEQPNRTKKKSTSSSSTENGNNQPSSNQAPSSSSSSSSSSVITAASINNPVLMAKLTDRLKLYDDILHRLIPDIKLTDLNDNPKPINPMKLIAALNKLREKGIDDSKNSSRLIAEEYYSLPDIPVPHIPKISTLPPSVQKSTSTGIDSSPYQNSISKASTQSPMATALNNSTPQQQLQQQQQSQHYPQQYQHHSPSSDKNLINSPAVHAGIDGSYESSMGKEIKIILPSREIAIQLITKTWENACVLFRFYHRPAFIEDLNELYDTDPGQYTNKQQRFLPLVYSVMACGALFFKSDEQTIGPQSRTEDDPQSEVFEDEGYKYFIAARRLIDITDTRDTYGIQTIVMLIIFLQCSARLSTCYAYIGIALRAALREGLHRKLDYPFNPIELEIRKRLFWTIYKMDIYVNTMLGLPRTISEDDVDQDLPLELDDENITVDGYRFNMQGDRLSSSGIANAHTTLIFIMKKIVTKLYPIKPRKVVNGRRPELLAHDIVYQLELELQDWMNGLPLELKPGVEPSSQYLKANRLLHISYLHVKIILYRPFIHYISTDFSSVQPTSDDLKSIEKAKNCINVARIVVKLAEDMIDKKMLSGSYWFSIYTIFFSVACLVYYVHFAPPINRDGEFDAEYMAIKKDAESGKRVLDILKDSSMAAKRTYNILNALFEQLNRRTAKASINHEISDPQFITPQVGKTKFEREQQKQKENESIQMPAHATSSLPPDGQFDGYNVETPKLDNSQINTLVNGVNFIDGVSTGINLNISTEGHQPADVLGAQIQGDRSLHRQQQQMQQMQRQQMQVQEQQQEQQSLNSIGQNGQDSSQEQTNKSKYVPGPMDQLDMKIFGRFLPPYMLNSNQHSLETSPEPMAPPRSMQTPQQGLHNTQGQQSQRLQQQQPLQNQQPYSIPQSSNSIPRSQTSSIYPSNQSDIFGDISSSIPSGLSTISQSQNQQNQNQSEEEALQNSTDNNNNNTNNSGTSGSNPASEYQDSPSGFDRKYEFDDFFFNDWSTGFPTDFNPNNNNK